MPKKHPLGAFVSVCSQTHYVLKLPYGCSELTFPCFSETTSTIGGCSSLLPYLALLFFGWGLWSDMEGVHSCISSTVAGGVLRQGCLQKVREAVLPRWEEWNTPPKAGPMCISIPRKKSSVMETDVSPQFRWSKHAKDPNEEKYLFYAAWIFLQSWRQFQAHFNLP